MAEHTPGPWIYVWREDRLQWRIGQDNGDMPVAVTFNQWPKDLELANARLIAAAPKLLEACNTVYSNLHQAANGGLKEPGKNERVRAHKQVERRCCDILIDAIRQAEEGKEK